VIDHTFVARAYSICAGDKTFMIVAAVADTLPAPRRRVDRRNDLDHRHGPKIDQLAQ